MEEFRKWLESVGFKFGPIRERDNLIEWYAYKRTELPARECECNDGKAMQIVVRPYKFVHPASPESVEVEICGEFNGVWYKLMAYGMRPEEARTKLPELEVNLIRAWNALG